MILKNASVLYGQELKYIHSTSVKISNDRFSQISPKINSQDEIIDCEGLLIIPGFVNCHTHIGDSIAKDVTLNRNVDEKIHPVFGAKPKILKKSDSSHLITFMRNSCISMIKKGITTFVDFREGGLDGVHLLRKAVADLPIRSIILGRVEHYQNQAQIREDVEFPQNRADELKKVLSESDGLGISGSNENSDSVLKFYSKTNKLRAIHSSETKQSMKTSHRISGKSETKRALQLKPHFLVHMTFATKNDLISSSKNTRGIVICPRANATLAEGIPNISLMLQTKCNLTLGTDNVMINSPDMFREMDYLWKVSMAITQKRVDPLTILKMATVNAEKMLSRNIGIIEPQKFADCIFLDKHAIDLEPMHSPYASIVHRASESTIRAVMIGGKVAHGKI